MLLCPLNAPGKGTTRGVEADESEAVTEDNLAASVLFAQQLSGETGAIKANLALGKGSEP
ncbi:MAG TPA: hypothetical protein GXX34_03520 [Clostridia bacterium]|nr:hypothetical protein [Clostridia bacterium]